MKEIIINFKNEKDKNATVDVLKKISHKTHDELPVILNKALRLYKLMIDNDVKII